MKKKLLIFFISFSSLSVEEKAVSFVTKKSAFVKPSQVKQEIAEIFESLLTQCCDMIVSVAQQQRLIVQHLKNIAEATGPLAEKNLEDLKKYKDELKRMKEESEKQIVTLEQQITKLEKFL